MKSFKGPFTLSFDMNKQCYMIQKDIYIYIEYQVVGVMVVRVILVVINVIYGRT